MNTSTEAENRRPLKSRQWPVFQSLAAWLVRKGISPNAISTASMLFALLAGVALASTSYIEDATVRRVTWALSAVFIQLRLVANLLDGMVAIEGGKKSANGELFNEVHDRVADAFIFVGAGYSLGGDMTLGNWATIIAVFVAYVRAMGASMNVGQVFLGPMAKPHRMALMTVICLFCCIAPQTWSVNLWGDFGIVAFGLIVIIAGGLITAVRRLARISQLVQNTERPS